MGKHKPKKSRADRDRSKAASLRERREGKGLGPLVPKARRLGVATNVGDPNDKGKGGK